MRHPEVSRDNAGYQVSWTAYNPQSAQVIPWFKIGAICLGCSMACFAGGFLLSAHQSARQVEQAEQLKVEAEQLKATASGDLDIARAKVSEQQQRLRLVNDCVYGALNAPLPTPIPGSPAN